MIAEALLCLALTVHYEARGEPVEGRIAVALVTRNRAQQSGNGYCWEAFKASQFSWTSDTTKLVRLPKGAEWEESKRVAEYVIRGGTDFTKGATSFHATSVLPVWAGAMDRVGQWGSHIFYRARPKPSIMGTSPSKRLPKNPTNHRRSP